MKCIFDELTVGQLICHYLNSKLLKLQDLSTCSSPSWKALPPNSQMSQSGVYSNVISVRPSLTLFKIAAQPQPSLFSPYPLLGFIFLHSTHHYLTHHSISIYHLPEALCKHENWIFVCCPLLYP